MVTKRTDYTLRARYPDMASARKASNALELAGVPASDIRLEGPGAEAAAPDANDQSGSDEVFMEEAMKGVLVGAAVGSVAGMTLALIGGLIWLGTMGVYVAAIAGLFGGGGLGFLIGGMARVQEHGAAQETFVPTDEDVIVALYTDVREDLDKAAERLRTRHEPTELELLDAEGKPLDA